MNDLKTVFTFLWMQFLDSSREILVIFCFKAPKNCLEKTYTSTNLTEPNQRSVTERHKGLFEQGNVFPPAICNIGRKIGLKFTLRMQLKVFLPWTATLSIN